MKILFQSSLSPPEFILHRPVTDRLQEMGASDLRLPIHVCQRTGYLQDPVISPGAEPFSLKKLLHQLAFRLSQMTEFSQMSGLHLGIKENTRSGKAFGLNLPHGLHPLADNRRGFSRTAAFQIGVGDRRRLHTEIHPF